MDELVLRGQGGITGLDLGATGKPAKERACTGSSDGSLRLWDLDHPPEYRRISAGAGPALNYLQFLRSLRTPSHSVPSVPDQYTAFAFHPKAPRIIALTLGLAPPQMSHLHIWDLETWTIARAFDLTGSGSRDVWPGILAIRPDGLRAAVAAPGGIALLDLETGKVVRTLKSLQTFQTLTFSPDGRRVAATGNSVGTRSMRRGEFLNEIQIWDEATGEELRRLRGFDFMLDHLAFHPDGRRLLGRGGEQTIHVWDVATGSKLAWGQAAAGLARVSPGGSGLALDREGRRLLTSDGVYDAETGKRLLSVGGSAFSPDGTRIAAVGKILEAEAGRELLTLPVPSGGIRSRRSSATMQAILLCSTGHGTSSCGTRRRGRPARPGAWSSCSSPKNCRPPRSWRIRRDPTISDAVRERALDLARLVPSHFAKSVLREEVLESLRTNPALSESVREQAMALAELYPEDPNRLNEASWAVVRRPDANAPAYRLALRMAEAAGRIYEFNGLYLNTLGVARYRVGKYAEAVATLTRSDQVNSPTFGGSIPADLAFLALAQHRLGQTEKARATLGRLRVAMKKPQWDKEPEAQGFLREAEAIEFDLVFPADPFALRVTALILVRDSPKGVP